MSTRLRLSKFLPSPVCKIYGDKDIPEAETLQSGLGQGKTDRQIIAYTKAMVEWDSMMSSIANLPKMMTSIAMQSLCICTSKSCRTSLKMRNDN